MSNNKKVDITNKYSIEIEEIRDKLNQLREGNIYGINNINCKSYGSLSENIDNLKVMLSKLIHKIEYGSESETDKMNEILK